MSSLASVNANSRRSDVREDLAFMSSPLSSVTSITYEQAAQLLKVATPVTCPYTDVTGKIIQLWKHHESLVASLLEGEKITLFPGENVCNSLNPSEKGELLLRRLESSSLKKWNFAYLPERSRISVCPFLATGISSRNEVFPDLQTQQHQIRQLQIAQDEQAILKRNISENEERISSLRSEQSDLRSEQATLRERITNLEIASADYQRRLIEEEKQISCIRRRVSRQEGIMASLDLSLTAMDDSCDSIQRRIEELQSLCQEMNEKWTKSMIDLNDKWRKDVIDTKDEYRQFLIDTREQWKKDALQFKRELEEIENETLKKNSFDTEQYLESLLTSSKPKKPVMKDKTLSHEKIAKTIKPLPEIISPKKVKFLDIPAKPPVDLVQGTNWSQILKTIAIFGLTIGLGSYVLRNRKLINSK